MDYMREINAFYDWLATNPISDSARNLWHALMHTANRAGWISEFAVAMSVIEAKTGMSRGAIYRARAVLKETGRIEFRNRNGNQSSVYRIIPFVSHYRTQNGAQSGTRTLHIAQHEPDTTRQHNTSYPSDTRKTKTGLIDDDDNPDTEVAHARGGDPALERIEAWMREEGLPTSSAEAFEHYFKRQPNERQRHILVNLERSVGFDALWRAIAIAGNSEHPITSPGAYIAAVAYDLKRREDEDEAEG